MKRMHCCCSLPFILAQRRTYIHKWQQPGLKLRLYTHNRYTWPMLIYYICRWDAREVAQVLTFQAARLLYCSNLVSTVAVICCSFHALLGDFEMVYSASELWAWPRSQKSGNCFILNLCSNIRTLRSCTHASTFTAKPCKRTDEMEDKPGTRCVDINRGGCRVLVEGREKLLKSAPNPLLQGIDNQTESRRIDFAFKSTRNV